MSKKTRSITLSALFAALTLVSLFFASLWPSGELGLAAFSSIFVAAAIIEQGAAAGVFVFIGGAVLGLVLFPGFPAPLYYASFFGYYPIIKSLIERVKFIPLQWVLKLAVFNAALVVMYYLLKNLVFDVGGYSPGFLIICPAGSAVFVLFDYGFTKVIRLYEYRIHGKFGR